MQATALRPLAVRCSPLSCSSDGAPSITKVATRSSSSFPLIHSLRHKSTSAPTLLSRVSDPAINNFILLSRISDPYVNLSLENFLLQNAHKSSRVLFLCVNWPCVVIGRNQNPWVEVNLRQLQAGTVDGRPIDLVRRRSGGGTVFHDAGNLNYSVIVPNSTSKGQGSFKRTTHAEMVVRAIASAKREIARDLKLRSPSSGKVRVNERHDIVTKAPRHTNPEKRRLKISGSAFKLTRGRALHHGTLLFGSPNLHRISALLRSPARDFIIAKGVASVRSPVGNLFDIVTEQERHVARKSLERTIVREFRRMYRDRTDEDAHEGRTTDDNRTSNVSDANDESTLAASITDADLPALASSATSIRSGSAELSSPAWLFEQTPGFTFSTHPLPSEPTFTPPPTPHSVSMQVKNGVIQASAGPGALAHDLAGKKLHEIRDWRAVVGDGDLKEALAFWLEGLFPLLELGREAAAAVELDAVDDVSSAADQVMWKRDDGTIEVERDGEQTVRDVVSPKDDSTGS